MNITSIASNVNFRSSFTRKPLIKAFGKDLGNELSNRFNYKPHEKYPKSNYGYDSTIETAYYYVTIGKGANTRETIIEHKKGKKEIHTGDGLDVTIENGTAYAVEHDSFPYSVQLVAVGFKNGDGIKRNIALDYDGFDYYKQGKKTEQSYSKQDLLSGKALPDLQAEIVHVFDELENLQN